MIWFFFGAAVVGLFGLIHVCPESMGRIISTCALVLAVASLVTVIN